MKKVFGLVCAGAVLGLMSGCGTNDPVSAPRVTINTIGSIGNGNYKNVTGKVEADTAISSIKYSILTSANADVPSTQIKVEGPNPDKSSSTKLEFTATNPIKITVVNAQAGAYKLKISATAGPTTDATFDFDVTGSAGTPVTTDEVTIGSYDNKTGSSIDLDKGKVLESTEAIKDGSGVDILGTYSAKAGSEGYRIFNPVYAKNSSNITAFAAWVNPPATSFHKVSVKFDEIKTVEEISQLYKTASAVDFSMCDVDNVFVVKTDQGKYALILIKSFETKVTGTAVIKYGK